MSDKLSFGRFPLSLHRSSAKTLLSIVLEYYAFEWAECEFEKREATEPVLASDRSSQLVIGIYDIVAVLC